MESKRCEKCNSNKVIEKVKITDLGHVNEKHNLSIYLKTTDRIVFNDYKKSEILAKVCCGCGKVELSIYNPNELWEAYLKSQGNK